MFQCIRQSAYVRTCICSWPPQRNPPFASRRVILVAGTYGTTYIFQAGPAAKPFWESAKGDPSLCPTGCSLANGFLGRAALGVAGDGDARRSGLVPGTFSPCTAPLWRRIRGIFSTTFRIDQVPNMTAPRYVRVPCPCAPLLSGRRRNRPPTSLPPWTERYQRVRSEAHNLAKYAGHSLCVQGTPARRYLFSSLVPTKPPLTGGQPVVRHNRLPPLFPPSLGHRGTRSASPCSRSFSPTCPLGPWPAADRSLHHPRQPGTQLSRSPARPSLVTSPDTLCS